MFLNNKESFNPFAESAEYHESELNRRTRIYFNEHIDGCELLRQKSPEADLKLKYKSNLELALVLVFCLAIMSVHFAGRLPMATKTVFRKAIRIEVADIPQTQQLRKPKPPERPSLPVPTEDESVPEDLTIASTELDLSDIPAPPPPPEPEDEIPIFVAYDEAPAIIGGIQSLKKHLEYPEFAIKAGLEAEVLLKVLVGIDGSAEKVELLNCSTKGAGFEKSAIAAMYKVRWKPARQRDRSIRVWIACPVIYRF